LPIEYPAPEARLDGAKSISRPWTPAKRVPVAERGPGAGCVSSRVPCRLLAQERANLIGMTA